jgi:hypothetical protein
MLVPWLGTEYTIRGKVVASLKFRLWWILWIHVCPWFVRAPKCFNYALTNLLVGLCRSVWVIELLVNFPSPHPEAPARPFTLEVLQANEHAPNLFPSVVFTFGLVVGSIKELGGASLMLNKLKEMRGPTFIYTFLGDLAQGNFQKCFYLCIE